MTRLHVLVIILISFLIIRLHTTVWKWKCFRVHWWSSWVSPCESPILEVSILLIIINVRPEQVWNVLLLLCDMYHTVSWPHKCSMDHPIPSSLAAYWSSVVCIGCTSPLYSDSHCDVIAGFCLTCSGPSHCIMDSKEGHDGVRSSLATSLNMKFYFLTG